MGVLSGVRGPSLGVGSEVEKVLAGGVKLGSCYAIHDLVSLLANTTRVKVAMPQQCRIVFVLSRIPRLGANYDMHR